jgi:predicted RNA-binding protein with RPS1 domain
MLLHHELYLPDNAMRLTLMFSCRGPDQEGEETGVKVGELVSGTVVHVADKVFILDVMTDKELMKGILTFPHLSDTSGHVEGLKGIIKVGHKLEQLLVLDVTDKQKLILSAKYSLVHRVAELPSDISQVQVQAVIPVKLLAAILRITYLQTDCQESYDCSMTTDAVD